MKHALQVCAFTSLLLAPLAALHAAEPAKPEIPPGYHFVFRSTNEFFPVTVGVQR